MKQMLIAVIVLLGACGSVHMDVTRDPPHKPAPTAPRTAPPIGAVQFCHDNPDYELCKPY